MTPWESTLLMSSIDSTTTTTIPTITIKNNSQVIIQCHRGPSVVYLRSLDTDEVERSNRLTQDVAKASQTALKLTKPPVDGDYLLAQFIDDNFYRAQVLAVDGDKIKIVYVDYGNIEVTGISQLRIMPQSLIKCPQCIAKATLKGIKTSEPTKEASDYLANLAGTEEVLKCTYDVSLMDGVELKTLKDESINYKINELIIQSTTINSLHDEELIITFKQLSYVDRLVCEKVCYRWSIIGRQSWISEKKMTIVNDDEMKNDFLPTMKSILIRCERYLNTLTVGNLTIDSSILQLICLHCKNLKHIDLTFKTRTMKHDTHGFKKMQKLESFKLTKISTSAAKQCLLTLSSDIKIIHIEAHILKTFSTWALFSQGGINLSKVLMKFNQLQSLTLKNFALRKILIEDIRQCQKLTFLDLQGCEIIDLSNLQNLKHLQYLEHLDVSYCKDATDNCITEIIKHCLNLKQLKIVSTSVTSDGIISFIRLTKFRTGCPVLHIYTDLFPNFQPEINENKLKIIYK